MPVLILTSADAGQTVPISGTVTWEVNGTDAVDIIEIASGTSATVRGGAGVDVFHFLGGSADYTVHLAGTNAAFTHTATGAVTTVLITSSGDLVQFGRIMQFFFCKITESLFPFYSKHLFNCFFPAPQNCNFVQG